MSKLLTEQNFIDASNELNVEVEIIKAVSEVESKGNGFFSDGRPKILFEAHIFSSRTNHQYDESHPNISSKKWNRSLYKGGEKEYDRLNEAIKLNRKAALESTSWGKFQVMGFNYKICGWKTITDFVNDMYQDENEHLKAFVGFIKSNNLVRFLQKKDFTSFAEKYNGPGFAQNEYDENILDAYNKYRIDLYDVKARPVEAIKKPE